MELDHGKIQEQAFYIIARSDAEQDDEALRAGNTIDLHGTNSPACKHETPTPMAFRCPNSPLVTGIRADQSHAQQNEISIARAGSTAELTLGCIEEHASWLIMHRSNDRNVCGTVVVP